MIAWLGKSIQRKVSVSYVAIFLITYSLSAFVIFTSISQTMRQTEADALTQIANQKLGQSFSKLDALGTNLKAWSRLEVMNDVFSGDIDKRISRTLTQLHEQYSLKGDIYVFDVDGKFVASSALQELDVDLPQEWVANADGLQFIDRHENPLVVDEQGALQEVIVLSHKIVANFNPNLQIGTIIATVPWADYHKILFDDQQPTLLVDRLSFDLLHMSDNFSDGLSDLSLLKDHPLSVNLMGVDYISGYANLAQSNISNWSVVALRTQEEANKPLWDVALKLLLLGAVLLVLMSIAIKWLSSLLTRPIHALEQTVSLVAKEKDLSLRAPVTTQDEIGVLAKAFNDMAKNLAESAQEKEQALKDLEALNVTLEKRVLSRTSELKEANSEITKAFDQLKSTQSQLVHSEKMASLGQLVAGVAHELNNPIGFIYANFPHLEEYANEIFELLDEIQTLEIDEVAKKVLLDKIGAYDVDFVKEDLHKIISSGKSGASRIKEIVSSLRSFSRLDESELKSVILESGLDDTLLILNHYLKDRIEVEKHYQLNEPILCRAGQINQVFTNIIFNAIQAMEDKGNLIIVTKSVGDEAVIEISDTGKGIPESVIERIFDPFFTTKKVGEGTGLGLSISYGIIEGHGGRLEVESTVGQGTKFTITLPKKGNEKKPHKENDK